MLQKGTALNELLHNSGQISKPSRSDKNSWKNYPGNVWNNTFFQVDQNYSIKLQNNNKDTGNQLTVFFPLIYCFSIKTYHEGLKKI